MLNTNDNNVDPENNFDPKMYELECDIRGVDQLHIFLVLQKLFVVYENYISHINIRNR